MVILRWIRRLQALTLQAVVTYGLLFGVLGVPALGLVGFMFLAVLSNAESKYRFEGGLDREQAVRRYGEPYRSYEYEEPGGARIHVAMWAECSGVVRVAHHVHFHEGKVFKKETVPTR